MRFTLSSGLCAVLAFVVCAAAAIAAEDAPVPGGAEPKRYAMGVMSPRCSVWAREASFAAAVEQHDAEAFAAHLADGAVFINGRPPHLHGEAAIVEGWRGIIAGDGLILRWHPEFIAIGGDGRTAISRGPYTMEDPDVNAPSRFGIGTFQSVWVRDAGTWRVMFDGGGPPPEPATEEAVRALQKSWKRACPFRD